MEVLALGWQPGTVAPAVRGETRLDLTKKANMSGSAPP